MSSFVSNIIPKSSKLRHLLKNNLVSVYLSRNKGENESNNYNKYKTNDNHTKSEKKSLVSKSFLLSAVGAYTVYKFKTKSCVHAASTFDDDDDGKSSSLRSRFNFVTKVIKKVSPAVVGITITRKQSMGHIFMPQPLQSGGSGFFVNSSGLLVTNAHVVTNAKRVEVTTPDGEVLIGKVVAVDESLDIAAVQVNCKGEVPFIAMGTVDDVEVGEWVIAVGSPLKLHNTFTVGVVSNKSRSIRELSAVSGGGHHLDPRMEYIQTDASINMGNSGGPLVNLDAEVIGMNTMKMNLDGISFAVPVDHVKNFINVLNNQHPTSDGFSAHARRYIGVRMISVDPPLIHHMLRQNNHALYDVTNGVLIHQVLPDSPAEAGGLQPYDVIVEVNGVQVHTTRQIMNVISSGVELLNIKVKRGRQTLQMNIRPEVVED